MAKAATSAADGKSGNRGGSPEQQAVKNKLSDLRSQYQQELVSVFHDLLLLTG